MMKYVEELIKAMNWMIKNSNMHYSNINLQANSVCQEKILDINDWLVYYTKSL